MKESSFILLAVIWVAITCLPAIPIRNRGRDGALFGGRGSQVVLVVIMFAVTLIALASISRFSLHAIPHIADETAYLFQARIFAEGYDYANMSDALKREVERRSLRNAIVFVRTEGLALNDGFFMNDPVNLSGRIFARDLGEKNWDLLDLHPGYTGYTWDKRTLKRMMNDE